jgi:hypothetical protein
MAAGDPDVPVTSWEAPDTDGGEPQADRMARERAAIEVCVDCPVMVQCLAYGSSVTAEGRLAEPHAILGGMTAQERRRAFVKTRQELVRPVPDRQLRTPQKLAVLRALAAHTDPEEVAAAAGMDVRTANWQRSILVGKLGLARDATRSQLLAAAADRGLLDGVTVTDDDGTVPAVPPPTKTSPDASTTKRQPIPIPAPAAAPAIVPDLAFDAPRRPARPRHTRRGRFTAVNGQLSLDDLVSTASVAHLPTTRTAVLEAAAA